MIVEYCDGEDRVQTLDLHFQAYGDDCFYKVSTLTARNPGLNAHW